MAFLLATTLILPTMGQVMRSQVYQQFMRAEMLVRRGDDSAAIAQLDEVARLAPNFPPTYLREAKLYDQLYQKNAKKETLNAAVFMYRKYLTLEFDEQLTKEASTRLRQLEDKLKVPHFEDEESRDSQQELASEKAIQIVTDDATAQAIAPQPQPTTVSEIKDLPAPLPVVKRQEVSYIDYYHANIPTTPTTQKTQPQALTPANLQGHWVTDITREDGREMWIFDLQPSGTDGCAITISSQSGILDKVEDTSTKYRQMWSMAKHYLQEAKVMSKTSHEIINERIVARPTPERFAFDVEVDEVFEESKALYKWGKNLVNNLSATLPFGTIINNYVNSYVEQQQQQNRSKSATWTYSFDCRSTAPGVLQCDLSSLRRYVDQNNRNRSRAGDKQSFVLFRADGIELEDSELDETDYIERWGSLFDNICTVAKRDADYNYPLAILYYYGVGTPRDERKAIELMNIAAVSAQDHHAKVWLTNYFYTQAYGNEENSTSTRRKMLKSAQYWCQQLKNHQKNEWYGVKGDMLLQDQQRQNGTTLQDSALLCFREGDKLGDLYSTLRLGSLIGTEKAHWTEAESSLNKAAEGGLADAYLELAHLKLAQKDLAGYLSQLRAAADHGCPEAFEELASNYMIGNSRGLDLNPQKSLQMKQLAKRAHQDEWISLLQDFGVEVELKVEK